MSVRFKNEENVLWKKLRGDCLLLGEVNSIEGCIVDTQVAAQKTTPIGSCYGKGIVGLDESSLGRGEGIKSKLLSDKNWVGGEELEC